MKNSNWFYRNATFHVSSAMLISIYNELYCIYGNGSDFVSVISGVPQGTVLGPLMSLLYINDIDSNILSSFNFLRMIVLSNEQLVMKMMWLLQKNIDEISRWAQRWQMKYSINKCVLLRFTRRHLPLINNHTLNNHTIKSSNTYMYLGILLDNSLSWAPHINNITNKATRMLNVIKRNLSKCNSKVKSDAYTTLV